MTKKYWKVVNYASNYWENYITTYFMNDVINKPWVYTETVYLLQFNYTWYTIHKTWFAIQNLLARSNDPWPMTRCTTLDVDLEPILFPCYLGVIIPKRSKSSSSLSLNSGLMVKLQVWKEYNIIFVFWN